MPQFEFLLPTLAVSCGNRARTLDGGWRRWARTAHPTRLVVLGLSLFYDALRHGMDYIDPGASYYETRYRERVVKNLHRRAKAFGFVLQAADISAAEQAVS